MVASKTPTKPTAYAASGTPDVRLMPGVPLTRSKSERARLLLLAQDIASASEGTPLVKNTSFGVGIPLQRSAASELALMVDDGMSL